MYSARRGYDPLEMITTFAGFVPTLMTLAVAIMGVLGLIWIIQGIYWITEISNGRGTRSMGQCVMQMLFGGGAIAILTIIGTVGKTAFGLEPANAAEMLYDAKSANNISQIGIAALLSMVQLGGLIWAGYGWVVMGKMANGTGQQKGLTWAQGIIKFVAGIACVFIHASIGFVSGLFGLGVAEFLNSI